VVAALIMSDEGARVLVQRRPPGSRRALLWEFPGGKVEAGESDAIALQREAREELGVELDVAPVEAQRRRKARRKLGARHLRLAQVGLRDLQMPAYFRELGAVVRPSTPAQFVEVLKSDEANVSELLKIGALKPE